MGGWGWEHEHKVGMGKEGESIARNYWKGVEGILRSKKKKLLALFYPTIGPKQILY